MNLYYSFTLTLILINPAKIRFRKFLGPLRTYLLCSFFLCFFNSVYYCQKKMAFIYFRDLSTDLCLEIISSGSGSAPNNTRFQSSESSWISYSFSLWFKWKWWGDKFRKSKMNVAILQVQMTKPITMPKSRWTAYTTNRRKLRSSNPTAWSKYLRR